MQKINGYNFYEIGSVIHPLTEPKQGSTLRDVFWNIFMAKDWLSNLLENKPAPLVVSKDAVLSLLRAMSNVLPDDISKWKDVNFDAEADFAALQQIATTAKTFETILAAELQNVATYFISKKGIYDTNDLILHADDMFTEQVKARLSEGAISDMREAGKCLAFDLGTAAGFHIARAVEQVLLDYLALLNPDAVANMKDAQRNLGNYIKLVQDNKGEKKVCSCLDQFRELHRNPLIHPESVLTVDEAFTLLGIAQSAIVAMTMEMEKVGFDSNSILVPELDETS